MADIVYLIIGMIAGLVVGGVVIYLLPYQNLRGVLGQTQAELADAQASNSTLQASLLEEQSKSYQGRQTLLGRQKRLEHDLAEASERQAELERQYAELKEQGGKQLRAQQQEVENARAAMAQLEQDQTALQDRFAQKGAEWDEERQSLLLLNSQLEDQVQELRREKTELTTRLDQQQETWERERLALQIQMNALEDNLTLQKARSDQNLPPDSVHHIEQLQMELADLKQQRTVWEEERQHFQEQFERLQAERRSLRTQVMESSEAKEGASPSASEQEVKKLRRQLSEIQQEYQSLKEKLIARDYQSEQERGALEAEIEQLMERLLRVQRERTG
jgi:chromosome segregation ATPase